MTNVILLEKAREGRRAALASLATREQRTNRFVSIFDDVFDEPAAALPAPEPAVESNVIAFRSARRSLPAPAMAQTGRLAA